MEGGQAIPSVAGSVGHQIGVAALFVPRLNVKLKKLRPDAKVPQYQTPGSAGFDLHAHIEGCGVLEIPPGATVKVSTGIAIWIGQPGWALDIMSRSGMASKGLVVAQGTGLVDSDYQGECCALMHNRSRDMSFYIKHGDRIAQGRFVPVHQGVFNVVEDFGVNTVRGAGGFGSTGPR